MAKKRMVVVNGEEVPLQDYLNKIGLTRQGFYQRLSQGYSEEKALTMPKYNYYNGKKTTFYSAFGEKKTLTGWLKDERCKTKNASTLRRMMEMNKNKTFEQILVMEPDRVGRPKQLVEAFGEKKTINEWLKDERCRAKSYNALYQRLLKYDSETAITQDPWNVAQK